MRSIRTKKFFGGIRSNPLGRRREGGQAVLEYLLLLLLAVSMFMIVARPYLGKLADKFQSLSKKGFLAEDPTGSNFYYFPIPRG